MSAKNTVIGDTGFWYALINRNDHYHSHAKIALENLSQTLITTWPVVTETGYLLQTRLSQQAAIQFIGAVGKGLMELFNLSNVHGQRMALLMEQYRDLPMDIADASLVVLAEELGHGRILSTDQRDFNAYRWKNRHPFTNLLLP